MRKFCDEDVKLYKQAIVDWMQGEGFDLVDVQHDPFADDEGVVYRHEFHVYARMNDAMRQHVSIHEWTEYMRRAVGVQILQWRFGASYIAHAPCHAEDDFEFTPDVGLTLTAQWFRGPLFWRKDHVLEPGQRTFDLEPLQNAIENAGKYPHELPLLGDPPDYLHIEYSAVPEYASALNGTLGQGPVVVDQASAVVSQAVAAGQTIAQAADGMVRATQQMNESVRELGQAIGRVLPRQDRIDVDLAPARGNSSVMEVQNISWGEQTTPIKSLEWELNNDQADAIAFAMREELERPTMSGTLTLERPTVSFDLSEDSVKELRALIEAVSSTEEEE